MNNKKQCEDILNIVESTKLRFGLKDPVLLSKLCVFSESFLRLSDLERDELISNASNKVKMNLLILTSFLAEEAINKVDNDYLKAGLVAHIFEGCEQDDRENIRHLVLLDYAASRTGATLKEIYGQLALNFKNLATKKLEAFLNRDSSLNVLKSYDIKAVSEDGIVKFVPISR